MKHFIFFLSFCFSLVVLATDGDTDVNQYYARYDFEILDRDLPISTQEHESFLQMAGSREFEEPLVFDFNRNRYRIDFDIEVPRYSSIIHLRGFDISVDGLSSEYIDFGNIPRGYISAFCQSSRINDGLVLAFIFYARSYNSPCPDECYFLDSRVFEVRSDGVTEIIYPHTNENYRYNFFADYRKGGNEYFYGGLGAGFIYDYYGDNLKTRYEIESHNRYMGVIYNDPPQLPPNIFHVEQYPYISEERILEGMRARGWCASEGFDLKVLEQEYADYDSERRRDIGFLNMILSELPLNRSRVTSYNNIAYYLEQSGDYASAIHLLEKIVKRFPDRVVAYINLGDAYWELEKHTEAREAYQTYIRLMRENNREQRIPQRVFDRVGD